MLQSHEKFYSANGRRLVLVADDEAINRALLGNILSKDYEVIYAADGEEALSAVKAHRDMLSLVLLDLLMPVMGGLEVLHQVREDPDLQHIPVIVITSDQEAEIESLSIGAIDFIPKPYPKPGVIRARVRRTIELSEDRQIINSTERDPLTGLYNREYFYRYAEQFDQHHKDLSMDAIVVDVNHFHMINERFGTDYGDGVLRRIGEEVREMVRDTGGIVCRREADTFLVYCPHGKDYGAILEQASLGLSSGEDVSSRVRLRMGVYANVDRSLDIVRRFDRAKMAADTVKGSFTRTIGIYDSTLHEKELYAEQLIEDFHAAIEQRQFEVFYQPKFDVRPDIPVLSSAEALVRWRHPELGMISPGVFIPLFEDNGLIQTLDQYVWADAAAQIRAWQDKFGLTIPVSVNVSRIDMYDPHLIDTFQTILASNGLGPEALYLEITESAYTQDSEQIIETVSSLRALGFKVEMDDFGTGYSSLNMISRLPIDALKLDMQFIRNAFQQKTDTRMLEVIIDIADYLGVPVIAEGVETREQMEALRDMGCDYIQGYYFSRPVPAPEYERFMEERRQLDEAVSPLRLKDPEKAQPRKEAAFGQIAHALSSGFESIYYVDTQSGHYVEFSARGKYEDLQIERSGASFFADTQRNILRVIYSEDQLRLALSMQPEALLTQLETSSSFSITYRIVIDGSPVYYNLKAVRAGAPGDHHIVIGVSNVDDQIRDVRNNGLGNELSFSALAQALSSDMESIYYVDTKTDSYLEFKSDSHYKKLQLELSGEDFFAECMKNIPLVVHPDDADRMQAALDREILLGLLREQRVYSTTYRLIIEGRSIYYQLKAVLADSTDPDCSHIIIGVSNVDRQVSADARLADQRQSSITYASIAQALARDYFSIYYVNIESDRFIEYSSDPGYEELGIEKSGDDFFNLSRRNILRVVHPDDVEMFLSVFSKENILREIRDNRTFTLTYRLMYSGTPTYVHMKATRMEDLHGPHLVVGVSNVDEQIRREHEHAQALRMANQDALTGVKSKHAYVEAETRMNRAIAEGCQEPFAVAICDVNGLKQINDTLGHKAGDQYIKSACRVICNIFRHSPVFRIGGDEFAAVLTGGDYEIRHQLMASLGDRNRESEASGGVVIAGGLADYRPGRDRLVASVFERADAAMYENKKSLKAEM